MIKSDNSDAEIKPSLLDCGRRRLIQSAALVPLAQICARVGGVSLLGTQHATAADCSAAARSLVCIFLAGGADSFNMFVPIDHRYAQYYETRKNMAVNEADLIGLGGSEQGEFGLHKALDSMASLYNAGNLAVVSNVGPLIQPTTPEDYLLGRLLPENLYAHDAQQRLWQTASRKVSGSGFGWGGAIAKQLAGCSTTGAFSIAGANAWQNNPDSRYISLNANARIERMFGLDPTLATWVPQSSRAGTAKVMAEALASASQAGQPLMLREAASSILNANLATQQLEAALNNHPLNEWTPDSGNELEAQLHLVARLISARAELNMQRQVFFVQLVGWDTHSNQNERLPSLLAQLNSAIGPYQNVLDSLGLAGSVTSFTASDFGRTLTSNGDGTDHGWGGHNFVFGAAVQGGKVYGDIPSFASVNNPDDAGSDGQFAGRIIPGLSVNQYGATLARWMGVTDAELDNMFPDLQNFPVRNLGFLG